MSKILPTRLQARHTRPRARPTRQPAQRTRPRALSAQAGPRQMAQARMVQAPVPKAPVQMRMGHGTLLRWTIKTVKVWALFPYFSERKM